MFSAGKMSDECTFSIMWRGYKIGVGVADGVDEIVGDARVFGVRCKRARLRRSVYMVAVWWRASARYLW